MLLHVRPVNDGTIFDFYQKSKKFNCQLTWTSADIWMGKRSKEQMSIFIFKFWILIYCT